MSTCLNRSTQNEAGTPGWVGRAWGCVLSCLTARLVAKGELRLLAWRKVRPARGRAWGLGLGGGPTTVRFVRLSPGSGSSGCASWDAAVVQSAVCSVCDYCQIWENSGSAVGGEERPSSCRGSSVLECPRQRAMEADHWPLTSGGRGCGRPLGLGAWGLLALNCFSLVFEVEKDGPSRVARRMSAQAARHPRTGGGFGPRRLAACTAGWLVPAMASSGGCCDDEMNEEWNTALRIEDDTGP